MPSPSACSLRDRPAVRGCYAWSVGTGDRAGWMHPTDGRGGTPAPASSLCSGPAFAQERAGAAFRAAGAGVEAPASVPYGAGVLEGITAAVGPAASCSPDPREVQDVDGLLRQSFRALDRCCAANGAIAASPRTSGRAGLLVLLAARRCARRAALHLLGRHGPRDVRQAAAHRARAWVRFVSALGPRLAATGGVGAGRCSMSGAPVGSYGDPQHDGPAATALVLLTLVDDPGSALRAAGPYLDHLLGHLEPGYDLWELVRGRSFHAEHLRSRALLRAAEAADLVGDPRAGALRAAGSGERLADFRQDGTLRPFLAADPPWFELLSGVDASTVGSALLAAPRDAVLPELADPAIAAVVDALVAHSAQRGSSAVVRFPEDTNDGLGSTGGRPWPVTTLWIAQWYLRRSRSGRTADPAGDRRRGLQHLNAVLASDTRALGEQLDWHSGAPRGARPLAWSHAELITTLLLL